MRSEQAIRNMLANVILQIIVFLTGIILPRFFLEAYGSSVNGMVTSVSQFLTYLGLAEAGVGAASVVALYKPLAEEDEKEVNAILTATRVFYNKSGLLFMELTFILALVYPYLTSQQLNHGMVQGMILVLAGSTFVDYFFLGKYKVFLTAIQKGYVIAYVQAAGTIMNAAVSIAMIYLEFPVVLVKGVATGVFVLRFFAVRWYVRKYYPHINFHTDFKENALTQRGAALIHQIVGVIVNNTDVVVLTLFLGSNSLLEVSVYGIYNMVAYAINTLMNSFSNGLTAGFGEVISKKEETVLKKSYSTYEYFYMIVLFIICICTGVLILPFIAMYTSNMLDVNYIRPVTAVLFTIIIFMQNVRTPGLTIICAAGHYKETQKQAVLEAGINIGVSMLLIWHFKMNGVLLGTICSYGYRSIEIMRYTKKRLIVDENSKTSARLIRNCIVGVVITVAGVGIIPQHTTSILSWGMYAMATGSIVAALVILLNYIFEPDEFRYTLQRIIGMVKRK